jgi:hypothetical protein
MILYLLIFAAGVIAGLEVERIAAKDLTLLKSDIKTLETKIILVDGKVDARIAKDVQTIESTVKSL